MGATPPNRNATRRARLGVVARLKATAAGIGARFGSRRRGSEMPPPGQGEHAAVADQVPRRPVRTVAAPPRKAAGTRQSRGWWLRRLRR